MKWVSNIITACNRFVTNDSVKSVYLCYCFIYLGLSQGFACFLKLYFYKSLLVLKIKVDGLDI